MEIRNILCPVDFSEESYRALKYAAKLAKKYYATLHVFHFYRIPVTIPDSISFDLSYEIQQDNEKILSKKVADMIKKVLIDDLQTISTHSVVRDGYTAATAISDMAEKSLSDLIVMYTKSPENLLEEIIGSVSENVLELVHCPVLIIPFNFQFHGNIKEIVFAIHSEVDNSVEAIISLARKFDAHISFITIEKLSDTPKLASIPSNTFESIIHKTTYTNISFHVNESQFIIKGIEAFAEKRQADILVMTAHYRGFIKKMFEKSVTKEIIFTSNIPVLVCHKIR